jgi:hypothetical protein
MARKQRWRFQVDRDSTQERFEIHSDPKRTTGWTITNSVIDELVIDQWFHLELMGGRDYWMQIGDVVINVRVGKDGKAESMTVENEPE